MSSPGKGRRILVLLCVWGVIFVGLGGVTYRFWWKPSSDKRAEEAEEQERQEILTATSADSQYKHHIPFCFDGFSGYAVLRSDQMKSELRRASIKLELTDDGADYVGRLRALGSGECLMASFTIDALLIAAEEIGSTPATIVAVIDETRGADLMVGYKQTFPNVDALNRPETRFVLVENSPSETMVRVMMASFNLDQLSKDPFVFKKTPQEVFEHYRQSKETDPFVYVVWQPFGTKILDNPNTHTIIDSSRFKGYIVDVIVVNRDFLYKNKPLVRRVVESYFRAYHDNRDRMVDLVLEDARKQKQPLTKTQAEQLVAGIWWKNTQENLAHFGVGGKSLQHVEDMIINLTRALEKTGAIKSDPTKGQPNILYYDQILAELHASSFHPGFSPEEVRSERKLPGLTDQQWERLTPIGTLQVPKLVFRRGTATLSTASEQHLQILIGTLNSFDYYLVVRGDASTRGNLEANQALATARAEAAARYLIENGISKGRIKTTAGMPTGETAVTFVLGETPY